MDIEDVGYGLVAAPKRRDSLGVPVGWRQRLAASTHCTAGKDCHTAQLIHDKV